LAFLGSDIKNVKALTIRPDGLVLYRMFGRVELTWPDILNVGIEKVNAGQYGMTFFPRIRTARGYYSFSRALNNKEVEVILTVKRLIQKAGRR
jgi:hypothetical protein